MNELVNKIKEAEAAEGKSEFLGASVYYKEALQMAQKLGQADKIRILKGKVIETSMKIKFDGHSVEQKILTAVLNKFTNPL